jgi:predicted ATPase/class 3 adenylate cyclase
MTSLPTGTVTFLFTDIEGSTRLACAHPEGWESTRQRHHDILKSAMDAHNGYVFQIVGDAFCVAFHTAGDAVRSAMKSQVDLYLENWGETPVKVRMGIHTGKAEIQTDGQYHGYLAMSRVQRLTSAAHGGQVLVSQAAQELVRDDLPENGTLRDLGEHRLKDLIRPDHIYQLAIPNLPVDFPPIKSLDAYRHNLPIQLTNFIGRKKDIAEIVQAVASHRLVTLTGSGGTGKTRLSLQAAVEMLDQFPGGIWFVELAPITNPDLIPQTILSAFKIGDQPGLTSLQLLSDYLREKTLLLIIDNCEHIIEAVGRLAVTLLKAAAGLKILATSREALRVDGELNWHVPSLSLPNMKQLPPLERLCKYEAIRLFIDRAALAQPHFAVRKDNFHTIARICARLDGIPLAIELAAVRVKALGVDQISERLDDRFRLLTGGSRTALPRQQTLRATIDWSYKLLSDQERTLFRRLAVFAGGWTLEAAEQVCVLEADGLDVLDLLAHLVDKSLVIMDESGGKARYSMLETTRQYAREKLFDSDEGEALRKCHRDWYLKFAERGDKELRSRNQILWLHKLDAEVDNLRAALEWCFGADQVEKGAQLANALAYFWWKRSYLSEAISWLEKALEQSYELIGTPVRAKALYHLGTFVNHIGGKWEQVLRMFEESLQDFKNLGQPYRVDYAYVLVYLGFKYSRKDHDTGWAYLQEGLDILRDAGDKHGASFALNLCVVLKCRERDLETVFSMAEEGMALSQQCGDSRGIALQLLCLGEINYWQGNYQAGQEYMEKSLDIFRNLEDKVYTWQVLMNLGEVSRALNKYEKAKTYYQEVLSIYQELGMRSQSFTNLFLNLGYTVLNLKDNRQALAYFKEALILNRESNQKDGFIDCLAGFAAVAVVRGKVRIASLLFGAVDAQIQTKGSTISTFFEPADRLELDRYQALCRARLGETVFESTRSEGRALTLEQALELALKTEQEILKENISTPA